MDLSDVKVIYWIIFTEDTLQVSWDSAENKQAALIISTSIHMERLTYSLGTSTSFSPAAKGAHFPTSWEAVNTYLTCKYLILSIDLLYIFIPDISKYRIL